MDEELIDIIGYAIFSVVVGGGGALLGAWLF